MLRNFGAVIAGCIAAAIIIMVVEMMGHVIHPLPKEYREALVAAQTAGDEAAQMKVISEYIPQAPVGALLFVPLAWGVGTLAGGFLAVRIARPGAEDVAYAVAGMMLLGGVMMIAAIPHPLWMVLGLLAFPAGGWLGQWLGRRPRETVSSVD